MTPKNLLYKDCVDVGGQFAVKIPTVGEILENEDGYYSAVFMLTAMPIDMMVQLDDLGIDFTTIDEYELFVLLLQTMRDMDTSLIFSGLDLSKLHPAINEDNGQLVMIDDANGIKIDRSIQGQIADFLRKIHFFEKNRRKPLNKEAKQYMIERARKKLNRQKRREADSQLEDLIVSLVNNREFKYDFEGTKGLTIYQFNRSLRQVIHKVDYDNRMRGIYAGTVSAKDMRQEDLTWLIQK